MSVVGCFDCLLITAVDRVVFQEILDIVRRTNVVGGDRDAGIDQIPALPAQLPRLAKNPTALPLAPLCTGVAGRDPDAVLKVGIRQDPLPRLHTP